MTGFNSVFQRRNFQAFVITLLIVDRPFNGGSGSLPFKWPVHQSLHRQAKLPAFQIHVFQEVYTLLLLAGYCIFSRDLSHERVNNPNNFF